MILMLGVSDRVELDEEKVESEVAFSPQPDFFVSSADDPRTTFRLNLLPVIHVKTRISEVRLFSGIAQFGVSRAKPVAPRLNRTNNIYCVLGLRRNATRNSG